MAENLKDPNKPAHEVVEVYEDGSALRNDGKKLKSARDNPWYILATIAGEQEVGTARWQFDHKIEAKNRRYWNGWSCATLDDDARAELAEKMDMSAKDLSPLSPAELKKVTDEFRRRRGDNKAALPDPDNMVDLSNTYFVNPLGSTKYVVSGHATFGSATFGGDAIFDTATFSGSATFDFATFSGPAIFDFATFSGPASFDTATFSGSAYFGFATFRGPATFDSAEIKSKTDFQQTQFTTHVPEFHAAKLYDDTLFTVPDGDPSMDGFWPPLKSAGESEIMPPEKQKSRL